MPIWRPSPNFTPRKEGGRPDLIVLHYTVLTPVSAALEWLCDPQKQVSAHYVIDEGGEVFQLVEEANRAWHAGVSSWQGNTDVNSRSIGIELVNDGLSAFAQSQLGALEVLLAEIMERHAIPPAGVVGHSDVAPGRKLDPGARFPWERLAQKGLALPAGTAEPPSKPTFAALRAAARQVGYGADVDDDVLLAAIRLRWRPSAKGLFCGEDIASLPSPLL